MLFATFDHHIPRSASSIESSGASEDEAISITKNPARELALMDAVGRLRAPMGSRMSFGPVVDRLAANGIDLSKRPVEVAPIAHYHMGGVRVDETLQARVPGLYACGEAVGGANGANRLSDNAINRPCAVAEESLDPGSRHRDRPAKRAALAATVTTIYPGTRSWRRTLAPPPSSAPEFVIVQCADLAGR
jgi:aspartate oxidase